jgi:hypothetical protein
MEDWLLMQTFYYGLTTSARENIDAAAGGTFLLLTIHEATKLGMERRTHSTMQERRNASSQGGGHVVCQDGPTHEEA